MNNVARINTFRDGIKGALDARRITLDTLLKELEVVHTTIMHGLKKITTPSKAPGHAEREEIVGKVLDDIELALLNLAARYGIKAEVVTTSLRALKPQVDALIVTVGDITEQHPHLLRGLAFSIVALLIPESFILGPFLKLVGFGPLGPVKGSAAACLQRHFWGGAVAASSWFAGLQAAGMGVIPMWAGLAVNVPLAIGAAQLARVLPRFNRT